MKFLKITTIYPEYKHFFYSKNPKLKTAPYHEQKAAFEKDMFFWEGCWNTELRKRGFESKELIWNCNYLQRAWEKENVKLIKRKRSLEDITLEQTKRFTPDVVWLHHWNDKFIEKLRDEVSSIKLIIGWVGSSVPDLAFFNKVDILFSCAKESVNLLSRKRKNVFHVNHWFVPAVNEQLHEGREQHDLCFIGTLLRRESHHLFREELLKTLVKKVNVSIFSNSYKIDIIELIQSIVKICIYDSANLLKRSGVTHKRLYNNLILKRLLNSNEKPYLPFNIRLLPYLKKAVFGIAMFQTMKDSKINLNIHANSSTDHASNLRMFEATGVGACLLTDFRKNISDLFVDGKEIVTFKSADDCLEKARWLLQNPARRKEIAIEGQKRVYKDHTFDNRMDFILDIIHKNL